MAPPPKLLPNRTFSPSEQNELQNLSKATSANAGGDWSQFLPFVFVVFVAFEKDGSSRQRSDVAA